MSINCDFISADFLISRGVKTQLFLLLFRIHRKRIDLRIDETTFEKPEYTYILDSERIFEFDMHNAVPPGCYSSAISVVRIKICTTKSILYSNLLLPFEHQKFMV